MRICETVASVFAKKKYLTIDLLFFSELMCHVWLSILACQSLRYGESFWFVEFKLKLKITRKRSCLTLQPSVRSQPGSKEILRIQVWRDGEFWTGKAEPRRIWSENNMQGQDHWCIRTNLCPSGELQNVCMKGIFENLKCSKPSLQIKYYFFFKHKDSESILY